MSRWSIICLVLFTDGVILILEYLIPSLDLRCFFDGIGILCCYVDAYEGLFRYNMMDSLVPTVVPRVYFSTAATCSRCFSPFRNCVQHYRSRWGHLSSEEALLVAAEVLSMDFPMFSRIPRLAPTVRGFIFKVFGFPGGH